MKYLNDNRIVMTLDAGGTSFVFSAIRGNNEIVTPFVISSKAATLNEILQNIIFGFENIQKQLPSTPTAISFAFPGPAEYELGIIGDLANLPLFRGGVALGPMLEEKFNLPTFINNDGDLFAYGEATAGLLPIINEKIKQNGGCKSFQNLLGITLGTGFGGGIVSRGELFIGDNSAQGEINRIRNKILPNNSVEDSVTIRGIQNVYCQNAKIEINDSPSPKEIFEIANGNLQGNKQAALKAYKTLAEAAGDAIANAITLVDGLVVIGGGLSGAHSLFLQDVVNEMNKSFATLSNGNLSRMEIKAYNLLNNNKINEFYSGAISEITVPFSDKKIKYDPLKRIGVGITTLGTSRATAIGAYSFALNKLDGTK